MIVILILGMPLSPSSVRKQISLFEPAIYAFSSGIKLGFQFCCLLINFGFFLIISFESASPLVI